MIDTAIILAGGLGTRLRPLTDETPKPLLPILGKPIIQHIIENLRKYEVRNIILSIGYKADLIKEYCKDGSIWDVNLTYSIETEPLGTGGAIKQAARGIHSPFFLVWGDNLMDINYQELYQTSHRYRKKITMALTPREDVEHFGVAKLQGPQIISFMEKPPRESAPSNLINAGAFVIYPECLFILPAGNSSIEKDCFEKFAPQGEIIAYTHAGQWFPTDTMEKYQIACLSFKPNINFTEKRVIIADVDETICESCEKISPEIAEQVDALIRRGYEFAFVSGTRVEDLLWMVSDKLSEHHHLLAATGTKYIEVSKEGNKTIYNYSLTTEEKTEIKLAFEKLIAYYQIRSLTTKEDQLQDRDSQITLSAIGRHAPHELKAKFDQSGEKRKKWIEFLKQHLDENKYELRIGGTTSIDITRKGLDKEWAIREFSKYHNINLSHIIFLGDKIYPGGNDYAASKIVDCIAVKNPTETLQKLKEVVLQAQKPTPLEKM